MSNDSNVVSSNPDTTTYVGTGRKRRKKIRGRGTRNFDHGIFGHWLKMPLAGLGDGQNAGLGDGGRQVGLS